MGGNRQGLQEVTPTRFDSLVFWRDYSPGKVTWAIDDDHWAYLHANGGLLIKVNPCDIRPDEYVPRGFVSCVYPSGTLLPNMIKSLAVFGYTFEESKAKINNISSILVEAYYD